MADPLTLPQRLRALAGEPWPFPVPDPDFGMTPNTMREAAARIEELEALLAGGFPKQTPQLESQTTQPNLPATAGVRVLGDQTFCTPESKPKE